ncbi:MAG: NADH-ubiquinone oxidoreductase-F iron-sulfur binding region domain-containing protein [Lachnospiraceae bacterium]|nr:NADH-ubiquinone oxidoreductase-F iron-sulfur binding region domain-containing protein [Lachnospiraceae bacterium]
MRDYMICNGVPLYPEAPVSSYLLETQMAEVVKAITDFPAKEKYLVICREQAGAIDDSNFKTIITEDMGGFVFGNETAVAKILDGEKPIPTGMDTQLSMCSVESLLKSQLKYIYVDGAVKKSGMRSCQKKIRPREILALCEMQDTFKGMYFGYPMGYIISKEQLEEEIELTTDYILILGEGDCVLDKLVEIAKKFEAESCGRCVFGHEGTAQIQMLLSDISQKKGTMQDIELLLELCETMEHHSLCEIGQAAARVVLTAIENFGVEIEEHITKKSCKAGICSKFVTYHILADVCTGCNECQEECPEDAIAGKNRFVHVIDQDECISCGICINACEEGAIVKAGAIKPRCPKKPIPCKK